MGAKKMKATIAGITYEGSPEEISRIMLLQHAERKPLGTSTERSAFIEEMKRKQQMSGSGSIDCFPPESYATYN
jgi:hypothetical protein